MKKYKEESQMEARLSLERDLLPRLVFFNLFKKQLGFSLKKNAFIGYKIHIENRNSNPDSILKKEM